MQLKTVKTAAATFIASMRICIKRGRGCYCAHAHETPLSKPWMQGGGGGIGQGLFAESAMIMHVHWF